MTIKTINSIKALLADGPVYIRYSRSHRQDIKRGYSLDHSSGQRHEGLSVVEITPADAKEGDGWIARLLVEYQFVCLAGGYGWVCRGRVNGTDTDGSPTITDVEYIDKIDPALLAKCHKYSLAYAKRRSNLRIDGPAWPTTDEYDIQ